MKKGLGLILMFSLLQGCVSFGVQCQKRDTKGWIKIKRIGFAPSKAAVENLATFKERICR